MKKIGILGLCLFGMVFGLYAQSNPNNGINQVFQMLYLMADGEAVQGFTWKGNLGTQKIDVPTVNSAEIQIDRSNANPIITLTLEGKRDVLSLLYNDYRMYINNSGGRVIPDVTFSVDGVDLSGWYVRQYVVTIAFFYSGAQVQKTGNCSLVIGVKR
jgi:hypothetical protein